MVTFTLVDQSPVATNVKVLDVRRPKASVTTLYAYNAKGEMEYTATDLDRNSAIDFAGTDRVQRSASIVGQASSLPRFSFFWAGWKPTPPRRYDKDIPADTSSHLLDHGLL